MPGTKMLVLCFLLTVLCGTAMCAEEDVGSKPSPEVMGIGGTARTGYYAIVRSVGIVKKGDAFQVTLDDGIRYACKVLDIERDGVEFLVEQVEHEPEQASVEVTPEPENTSVARRRRDPFLPVGCAKELP
jgi:hypothetical protein